ncbi:hypothetical protein D3I60_18440 [Brevibacterium permense]|uniref:hypothetical protein n=1 Tax=Brevibacterium permense TaxID=234834 RepID=UPI0021D27438|nr:hypothetical protein [Brevibacterium permense]MCU4299029.1 hypothetical protein [Brevibacterium permense]
MTYTLQAVENSAEKASLIRRLRTGALIVIFASVLCGLLAWNEPHPVAVALAVLVGGAGILAIDIAVAYRALVRRSKG